MFRPRFEACMERLCQKLLISKVQYIGLGWKEGIENIYNLVSIIFLFTLRQRDLKKEDSPNIIVCVALTSRKWRQLSSLTEHSFLFMLIELRQAGLGLICLGLFLRGIVLF